MRSVLQLGLVALTMAVAVPVSMPASGSGEGSGSVLRGLFGGANGAPRTQAERDADVRRRMAAERVRREQSGNARATRRSSRGTATVQADRHGHFNVEARINRRAVEVLVDTGATLVSMNETTARRAGVRVSPSDFVHTVHTANGTKKAARVTLDRVRIGNVELRDVEASISSDDSMDVVLLGMSFLGRLDRFGVEDGTLVLVQ